MFVCLKILDLLFFDFLNLDEFLNVLITLPPTLTILFSLALNAFEANALNHLVVFIIEINNVSNLLRL